MTHLSIIYRTANIKIANNYEYIPIKPYRRAVQATPLIHATKLTYLTSENLRIPSLITDPPTLSLTTQVAKHNKPISHTGHPPQSPHHSTTPIQPLANPPRHQRIPAYDFTSFGHYQQYLSIVESSIRRRLIAEPEKVYGYGASIDTHRVPSWNQKRRGLV
jgi:hypothetical protein